MIDLGKASSYHFWYFFKENGVLFFMAVIWRIPVSSNSCYCLVDSLFWIGRSFAAAESRKQKARKRTGHLAT